MDIQAELMTTAEAAEMWGISTRRTQILCEKGKAIGAVRMGRTCTARNAQTVRWADAGGEKRCLRATQKMMLNRRFADYEKIK